MIIKKLKKYSCKEMEPEVVVVVIIICVVFSCNTALQADSSFITDVGK